MLSFQQVTLRRGARKLLEDLSLTVHAGQKVGLVGRNGTGKSSPVSYTHLTLPTIYSV